MSGESQAVHVSHAPTGFIRKYIFSVDHKIIGIQYFFLALAAVFVGLALSVLMRFHLLWPAAKLPFLVGGVMTQAQYLSLVTMHGTLMVFFVLTTAPQSGFGNYFLPIQIGAADMAFPHLNMLSFWVTFLAFVSLLAAFFVPDGAPIAGWTAYTPLSGMGQITGPGEGWGQTMWIDEHRPVLSGVVAGCVEFHRDDHRFKSARHEPVPHAVDGWGWFVTAILGLLAFGVLLAGGILLLLDRSVGTSFFLPAGIVVNDQLVAHSGGSPLLWQHLFWFFGHPEVYIAILAGDGSGLARALHVSARKPIFGYKAMVYAMNGIGILGFMVWGHHMFVSGMSPYSGLAFSVLTMAIGVPSAIKTFNWLGTLWGSKSSSHTPMLYALGFVSLFVSGRPFGNFSGPAGGRPLPARHLLRGGALPLMMGVAAIFGIFAATYFWFPKMFGRMMNETLGENSFLVHPHRRVLHLHADALSSGWSVASPALRGLHRHRLSAVGSASYRVRDDCGVCYRHGADCFPG
jgi:cytochrome c oxidase subunit 1